MSQNIRRANGLLRDLPPKGDVVLPKAGETNVLITSALPYCNNVPHLGNIIGSTLSADVFSRYNRTRNRRTLYICGTDEYGTATETQALKEGITPQELCDKYHALHRGVYDWFEIAFDHFGRTSAPKHTEISQEIYTNLSKNGKLIKQTKEQTYCEGCSKFLADRFVEGTCPNCGADDARGDQCDTCSRTLDAIELINPRCLVNKTHRIVSKESAHMYVRLDEIQPRTEEWIKGSWKAGNWSPNAVINADGHLVDARLKSGLRPSPVTRDLQWGVPVPNLEGQDNQEMRGKVLYVWFDAPIGYPSITAAYTTEWKQWWFNHANVRLYQFMGKDNVYFHTIFWPSIQLGDGRPWTMLHHLSTTEYLNYEGGKFSKSHNRGVFGPQAKETGIPVSVWRFYLLWIRPENQDAAFSWAECIAANNNILLKNFGNFINRITSFVAKNYDSIIPDGGDPEGPLSLNDEHDADFIGDVNSLLHDYIDAMEAVKLRHGLQLLMQLSSRGNGYLQAAGLNTALKTSDPKRCAQVVTRAINLIYILSVLAEPFIPGTSASILSQLNAPARSVPESFSIDILPGHHIGKPAHLFKPIDEKMAETWRTKFEGTNANKAQVGELDANATHVQSSTSKRKAAKKVAVVASTGPKSPEMLALEAKVSAQGDAVRALKAKTPKSKELDEEIATAVGELKRLKAELVEATQHN
ncbi:methionyl tRNA synthetase [Rickenella mellea]|uniref:methionine--tRNA ligase n=1 Tax=Rickenella mellea TaxID=50990 RepID=A0A4Y7PH17_9AGAM|nr:methionyl tRNA synthetase [Rickenella mellea]